MYYLKMKSVDRPKYITTWKPCNFLISKGTCMYIITNQRSQLPLKCEICIIFVRYFVHISSQLFNGFFILYDSLYIFVINILFYYKEF